MPPALLNTIPRSLLVTPVPGDEFILARSPGPAAASYLLTIFFFELSDSDFRLSCLIANHGNEIMYTIK